MAKFTPPEDVLINAMKAKQPGVRLERCVGSLENVFRKALKKERRLLAFLGGYNASYMKSIVQLSYDYDVTITYSNNCPSSIDDVVIVGDEWKAESLLKKGAPAEITMVTADYDKVEKKLTGILTRLNAKYEGIHGWKTEGGSFEELSKDSVCSVSYNYILPIPQLRGLQGKAMFESKRIWRKILGRANVPQFVKPFLAFSYLTQECCYDQRAFDEVESDETRVPSDPIPHLAYGPLAENRGICSGLAWAFKTLMDDAGIECQCISGYLKADTNTRHMWNLVKIDGMYYHVDPTWGIRNDGVVISCLMQPDVMMRATHIWQENDYPKAGGMRFDYDYIENYLADNGDDFIDDGAEEKYFFPERIMD